MERIQNCGRPIRTYEESLRTAISFLTNPYQLWVSEHFDDKRAVLKLAFPQGICYARKQGYLNRNPALPFKVLGQLTADKKELAPPAGVEGLRNSLLS